MNLGQYFNFLNQVYNKQKTRYGTTNWPDAQSVSPNIQRLINVQEEELENFSVKVCKGDVLVVPEGQKEFIPERFRNMAIELPHSHGYAVIKGR